MALLLKIHGFLGFPCENPPSVGQAFAVCLGTYPIHKASGVTKKTVQLIGTPGGRPTAKRDTGQGLKQQDIESLRDETNCWGIPNGVHLTKTATLNNQKKRVQTVRCSFPFLQDCQTYPHHDYHRSAYIMTYLQCIP
jgi:hypothetical protein